MALHNRFGQVLRAVNTLRVVRREKNQFISDISGVVFYRLGSANALLGNGPNGPKGPKFKKRKWVRFHAALFFVLFEFYPPFLTLLAFWLFFFSL